MASQDDWQVSGSAAEQYERHVASFFAPWAVQLVARAGLQEGWKVLDVACGTGIVARAAGPVVGATGGLVGSDLNEGMLVEARRHPVEGAPVEWRRADATELPFTTADFDAVLCQQGLQFMPDKAAAVGEMRRVLRPGGVAGVSVWGAPDQNPYISALADGLSRHLSPEAGESMLAPCGLGDRGELLALFEGAGFASVTIDSVELVRDPIDAIEAVEGNLAALPMTEQIQAMEPAARAMMLDDIMATLDSYISDGILHQPMAAHIAIAIA